MNTENKCLFVSSRGILNSCTVKSYTPKSSVVNLANYNFRYLEDGCSIYVCGTAIKHFISIIPKINLIHWFTQNCVINHKKLSNIPIGLDYHTISSNLYHQWGPQKSPLDQEKELIEIRKNMKPFYERVIKAYSNFHFATDIKYGNDRIKAINEVPKDLVFYEPTTLPIIETWKNQIRYAFVLSPMRHGYDCHRTWEALCLGCIPIIKKMPINNVYDDLPVLIVDEWRDLTAELLEKTIMEFATKQFNYNKLLLSYWTNKIKNPL
jgi:hypothetical protein